MTFLLGSIRSCKKLQNNPINYSVKVSAVSVVIYTYSFLEMQIPLFTVKMSHIYLQLERLFTRGKEAGNNMAHFTGSHRGKKGTIPLHLMSL